MFNPVTDRLKLVEKDIVPGRSLFGKIPLSFLGQEIPAIEGISQEIYRGETHIASVRPASFYEEEGLEPDTLFPVRARSGDTLYHVTLASQPYNFTGTIQTQDHYQRIYDMHIVLAVKDPTRVVDWYRQSKDPANWVVGRFKSFFEASASSISHDMLSTAKLPWEHTAQLWCNTCGIKITQYTCNFRVDSIRAKELEIYRNTELRKIEMKKAHELKTIEVGYDHTIKILEERHRREREREQKEFERSEKLKNNDFAREERRRSQQNAAYIHLLSETVKDLVEINRGQIHDAAEYDAVVKAVLQNSLGLLKIFEGPLPEPGKVIETESPSRATIFDEEDGTDPHTKISLPGTIDSDTTQL